MSVNGLLSIGQSALLGHQAAINVVGNNIANVDTVGYSRQWARFESRPSIAGYGGLFGQGVDVAEVERQFSRFVEDAYLDRFSPQSRWAEQRMVMSSVESIFNESSERFGISSAMSDFFNNWQDVTTRPEDSPSKEQLLSTSNLLASLLRDADSLLAQTQREMDLNIEQTVNEVNQILGTIAQINQEIAMNHIPGQSNANQLLDLRDLEVRKLASLIDIDVTQMSDASIMIATKAGHTLLSQETVYSLEVHNGRVENSLRPDSTYEGSVEYSGSDTHEYTFEVLEAADRDAVPPTNGSMRVSLDGGSTWMRNSDGSEYQVDIPHVDNAPIKVKDLEITFTGDTSKLVPGDKFEVLPKMSLMWNSPTSDLINITPQVLANGTEDPSRVRDGTLAAYFAVRDYHTGRYSDKLNALTETLIWEVNRLHSQGAGLDSMSHTFGSEYIGDPEVPMGDSWSGIHFSDRLTAGNMGFQIYDEHGEPVEGAPVALDFMDIPPGSTLSSFDPAIHSFEDVQQAINGTYGEYLQVDMVDGKMQMTAKSPNTFSVRDDSTGILAALGVNTFFQGNSASSITLKEEIRDNLDFINAGSTNSNGVVTEGNGSTATAIASLVDAKFTISTGWETTTTDFAAYYGGLVGLVGSETKTAIDNNDYNTALASDLGERASAYSGVNLDEEMASLIRFQHSYTAAAKLITTADQMLQILLGLKQ